MDKREALRTACWHLKQSGYDPIPLWDKESPYKGWPAMPNDEAAIQTWNGRAIGIRLYRSELLVIDFDIHVEAVRDKMVKWIAEHHPEFAKGGCLCRHSGAISIALIGRAVTAKGTQKTKRFIGEGTSPKGDFVEVFTGNSKKYVGILGEHSRVDIVDSQPAQGFFRRPPRQVVRSYGFRGRSILEVPVDALPWFPDAGIAPMLAAFEEIMAAHGLTKVVPVIGAEAAGTKVFDLLPEMIFTLSDETKLPLIELEDWARQGIMLGDRGNEKPLKGYADLWDPSTGGGNHSSTRVLVTYGGEGLCLYDTKFDVRHRWKSSEPREDLLGPLLRELMTQMMAKAEAEAEAVQS